MTKASAKKATKARKPVRSDARKSSNATSHSPHETLHEVLDQLKQQSSAAIRDGMGPKYGIHTAKAFGVSMANMKVVAKRLGKSHELAAALWDSGWYEARMVASMVDEPARVTSAQMDRWCRDFDNWAICDTVCFNLFDRTEHAWAKVVAWSKRREEHQKRAAFALLWSLSVHDKRATDAPFMNGLLLIERAANDERNFVKKAVNMALRATGKRNLALHAAAVEVAQRLAGSNDVSARWVGKDALRELVSPAQVKRLAARSE